MYCLLNKRPLKKTSPKDLFKKIKRTYKINFPKLQVTNQVPSRIRFGNGHNHEMFLVTCSETKQALNS